MCNSNAVVIPYYQASQEIIAVIKKSALVGIYSITSKVARIINCHGWIAATENHSSKRGCLRNAQNAQIAGCRAQAERTHPVSLENKLLWIGAFAESALSAVA